MTRLKLSHALVYNVFEIERSWNQLVIHQSQKRIKFIFQDFPSDPSQIFFISKFWKPNLNRIPRRSRSNKTGKIVQLEVVKSPPSGDSSWVILCNITMPRYIRHRERRFHPVILESKNEAIYSTWTITSLNHLRSTNVSLTTRYAPLLVRS